VKDALLVIYALSAQALQGDAQMDPILICSDRLNVYHAQQVTSAPKSQSRQSDVAWAPTLMLELLSASIVHQATSVLIKKLKYLNSAQRVLTPKGSKPTAPLVLRVSHVRTGRL